MLTIPALFFLAALTLNVTPGPDMLYVISRSLSQCRSAGIVSSLGIAAGCFFHIAATVFGFSQLLTAVPAAFEVVKLAGAAYLVYLGARTLLGHGSGGAATVKGGEALWAVFRQGVITNVLNPKVALFFLAFLPQFVDRSRGNVALQFLVLGVLFNVSGACVNVLVASAASKMGNWARGASRDMRWLNWLTGTIFIGLGMRLALLNRR